MGEIVRISIVEIVGSGICVSSDDGQKIYDAVAAALESDRVVEISFQGIEDLTSAFLNVAIGQLYGGFSEESIKARVKITEIAPEDLQTLKRTVDRAKEYFRDPERFHAAAREVLGSDDE